VAGAFTGNINNSANIGISSQETLASGAHLSWRTVPGSAGVAALWTEKKTMG